jgi:hypothetical protein
MSDRPAVGRCARPDALARSVMVYAAPVSRQAEEQAEGGPRTGVPCASARHFGFAHHGACRRGGRRQTVSGARWMPCRAERIGPQALRGRGRIPALRRSLPRGGRECAAGVLWPPVLMVADRRDASDWAEASAIRRYCRHRGHLAGDPSQPKPTASAVYVRSTSINERTDRICV